MFSTSKFFRNPPSTTPTDPYFNYTTLLLNDTGTNGAQNNTFLDSSTNNFTITRNGNTTQGSVNPYEPTGSWAGYFGGTQYLSISNTNPTTTFGSGNFTIEAWIFVTSTNISQTIVGLWNYTNNRRSWELATSTTGTLRIRYSTTGSDNLGAIGATAVPTNQWVHVAFVRNGTSLVGYLNGVNSVSTTTASSLYTNTLDPVRMGYSGDGAFTLPLTGYISNVRVVKGTAVYTANFTPPTAPLTAISGTSILCLQSNRFIDNSSNNFYIAPSGPPSVTGFNPFAPTASYTTSAYGGSGYFDGTGDYLSLTSTAALQLSNSTAFTIECWVYADASVIKSLGGFILRAYNFSSPYQGYGLGFGADGTNSQIQFWDGTAWNSFGTVSANTWTHIAISYEGSGSTRRFFINGVQQGSAGTVPSTINWTGTTFNIGTRNADFYYMGYISNFRIVKGTAVYTAAFTPPTTPLTAITNTSLLLNATNAGIYDATTLNNMETVGNAQVSTTQAKWGSSSMAFDGTGDWLLFPNRNELLLGTGNFTIEGWVYLSAVGAARGIVGKGTATTGWLVSTNSTNNVVFTYGSSTITSTGTLSVSTWYHIAVVRQGTGTNLTKIYINGTNDGTGTVSTDFNQTNSMYVGADRTAGSALNGYIEDLRITKGIARYTSNFTAPTAPFPTR